MQRRGPFFRFGLFLPLAWAGSLAVHAQEPPPVDPNKVSVYANKSFDFKTIDLGGKSADFTKNAPGFDKEYKTATSDWTSKKAELGGRDIYAPTLDFNKVYPTSDSSLFQGMSPLSSQASSLTAKTAPFSAAAQVPEFQHVLDDKTYQGREADIIREAMDRLDRQSRDSLSQSLADAKNKGKDNGSAPVLADNGGVRSVKPLISVDDVKLLVDKDITPASEAGAPRATAVPAAAPTPAPLPAIKAAP